MTEKIICIMNNREVNDLNMQRADINKQVEVKQSDRNMIQAQGQVIVNNGEHIC